MVSKTGVLPRQLAMRQHSAGYHFRAGDQTFVIDSEPSITESALPVLHDRRPTSCLRRATPPALRLLVASSSTYVVECRHTSAYGVSSFMCCRRPCRGRFDESSYVSTPPIGLQYVTNGSSAKKTSRNRAISEYRSQMVSAHPQPRGALGANTCISAATVPDVSPNVSAFSVSAALFEAYARRLPVEWLRASVARL
jgi:hypothetical protein